MLFRLLKTLQIFLQTGKLTCRKRGRENQELERLEICSIDKYVHIVERKISRKDPFYEKTNIHKFGLVEKNTKIKTIHLKIFY